MPSESPGDRESRSPAAARKYQLASRTRTYTALATFDQCPLAWSTLFFRYFFPVPSSQLPRFFWPKGVGRIRDSVRVSATVVSPVSKWVLQMLEIVNEMDTLKTRKRVLEKGYKIIQNLIGNMINKTAKKIGDWDKKYEE